MDTSIFYFLFLKIIGQKDLKQIKMRMKETYKTKKKKRTKREISTPKKSLKNDNLVQNTRSPFLPHFLPNWGRVKVLVGPKIK